MTLVAQAHAERLARCLLQTLSGENHVEPLAPGAAASDALFEALGHARVHVNVDAAVVGGGAAAQHELLRRLALRRRHGVCVNLLSESEFVRDVKAAACRALRLSGRCGLAVIDGRTAFIGGDAPLRVQGPVVADLQQLFIAQWLREQRSPMLPGRYFPPLAPAGTQRVAVCSAGHNRYYRALLAAIDAAQQRIVIGRAGLLPTPRLRRALSAAQQRGVDVRTPERCSNAVIDGVWTALGTGDLGWRDRLGGADVKLVLIDADFGGEVESAMVGDHVAPAQPLARWAAVA